MRQLRISTDGLPDPPGVVRNPSVDTFPPGYRIGVTRYADLILRDAFPERFGQLSDVLDEFRIGVDEILQGGGSRSPIAVRFDSLLKNRGWGKRTISISKSIDDVQIHATRGHEIDMFAAGAENGDYPGLAVEMEWNNKDPFFDRDLLNFMALHREGALAVGVIVTRGPELQRYLGKVVKTSERERSKKFGQSTTHWGKLIPRINLGGGGECPLIVIGIEPERVTGFERIIEAYDRGRELWR
ncbi:MAG TPA: BglII/BstYI family type II restriction endonuclease [Thermomicrobiales bacterium]|nr:BglII/BstYI family type II restriction endonuclease [Thermomicrobiales bacterium]